MADNWNQIGMIESHKISQAEKTEHQFRLSSAEIEQWDRDGYLVRQNVFSTEENDFLRQVAEDIVNGKRSFPAVHVN